MITHRNSILCCQPFIILGLLLTCITTLTVAAPIQLDNEAIFYWNFNTADGGGAYADLVNNVALSPVGGNSPAIVTNSLDTSNALDFDGINDGLASNTLNFTNHPYGGSFQGAYAVELDVLIPTGQASAYVASSAVGNNSVRVNNVAPTVAGNATIGLTPASASAFDITPDVWHKVVIGFYGSGAGNVIDNNAALNVLKVSVDGGALVSLPSTDIDFNFTSFRVGQQTATAGLFSGNVDNLAFYDLSRSGTSQAHLDTAMLAIANGQQRRMDIPGITYSYLPPPAIGPGFNNDTIYSDTGGTELTNHVGAATPALAANPHPHVGFENGTDNGQAQPGVLFDLHAQYNLQESQVHYMISTSAGIRAPDQVLFEFSNDGISFFGSVIDTGFTDINLSRIRTIDLSGNTARYVRMSALNDAQWTFLYDVRFFGTQVPIPEPSSLILMLFSMVGGVLLRRRYRW